MGVGAAHGCAFVLKDLHPGIALPQLGGLFLPGFHDLGQGLNAQFRQGFAVIRREADHPAGAACAFAAQQRIVTLRRVRRIGHQGGKVVSENEGACIVGVNIPGHAGIPRTEETVRIVLRQRLFSWRLLCALPGTLGAMR